MDRTDGQRLLANEYHADGLRRARERETKRDEHTRP